MSEKIKVKKKIAEVIEDANNIYLHCNKYEHIKFLINHETLSKNEKVTAVNAILNGYEVEQSPEEKIRELFEEYNDLYVRSDEVVDQKYLFARDAIAEVLDILEIEIEGINDK